MRLQSRRALATFALLTTFACALPSLAAEPEAEGKTATKPQSKNESKAEAKPEAKSDAKRMVNINSADATQLALLPRVGPSLAQKILEYRKKSGPFKTIEDLLLVRGVGDKSFQLLRPYLTVSGETTLKEKVHGEKAPKSKEGDR